MESLKIAVMLTVVVTFLPFLADANPIDNSNSSKPYCNITLYFPRTSIEEVRYVINDALAELKNTCNENEVECVFNITMANETELIRLQDIANARLEILLGKMQRINELCKIEEIELYRGNESFTAVCNVLRCKTMSVIEKITEYLLDEKCGCEEECRYSPGRYIEFTQDTTILKLLQEAHYDVSFFQNVISQIKNEPTEPIPPIDNGDYGNITPPIPEPDGELY